MKKRIISITIFILSFFVIYGVKAEEKYTVADVNYKFIEYNNAVSEYNANNCNGTLYTQIVVNKCNSIGRTKMQALTYLFNAKAYDKDLISDDIQKVLDENSSACSSIISSTLQEAINKVYLLMYIAGPILLILFGSVDLTSAVVAGDEKQRKAAYTRFVRRTISLVLLFAAPVLVRLLINTFGMSDKTSNKYACTYSDKKVTISYISRRRNNKGNAQVTAAILDAADKIKSVSSSKQWEYTCTGAANVLNHYESNTYTTMCCADYVSAVLQLAGVFTAEEINGMGSYNSENCPGYNKGNTCATAVHVFLHEHEWIRITDIDDLEPGDITFYWPQFDYTPSCLKEAGINRAGHVEIYAGDNKAYSGGSTDGMRKAGALGHTPSYSGEHRFIEAYRYPGKTNKKK